MFKRSSWLPLTLAGVVAAAVAFTPAASGGPKDDPAEMKEKREEVRKKYDEDKGGMTFFDLVYWVDVAKLEDTRWSKEKLNQPKHERGAQLYAKWTNPATAAGGKGIVVIVRKLIHYTQNGSTRQPYSMPFEAYGESVPNDDLEGLINGFWEDWKRTAKDVSEDDLQKPKKKKFGVTKFWAGATATNPESETRERREFYGWINSKEVSTYIVEVQYGASMLRSENLMEKGQLFVKNMKELPKGDAKKVEWPD